MTPSHKRNAECSDCLRIARLVMPVRVAVPGFIYTTWLCLACRLGWRDVEYACLATTIEHSRSLLDVG